MPTDFSIDAQLEQCRKALLGKFTTGPYRLEEGNCFITADSISIKGFGRLYVELWDDGGTYEHAKGGLATCNWVLGVAIRNVLMVDQLEKYVAASRELRKFGRQVRNLLHLHYDPSYFPVPPIIGSHGKVTRSSIDKTAAEHAIELRFRMVSIERYSEIKP